MKLRFRCALLHRRLALVLIAGALAVAGCAYTVVRGGRIDEPKAAGVVDAIQKVRELRFKQQVPMTVKTADEAERMMEDDLAHDYTDEQIAVDGAAGAAVGLYPAGMDLKAETLKLLKNQVAGFYDPYGKQMVLIEGAADLGFWTSATQFVAQRDYVGEMLLGHELTHALQDQHFELEKKLDAVKDDDDRGLALKSVAEGDATIAGFGCIAGRMDRSTLDALVSRMDQMPQLFAAQAAGTPLGVSAPMVFQYTDGVRFVAEAYRRGGWSKVDELYRTPPLSSHQILHPEYYFDHLTPPPQISLDGYQGVMAGWTKADDDTYGELFIRVILERNLGKDSADVRLASRWSADRMVMLRKGHDLTVLWMIAFGDAESAARFGAVYADVLGRLPGSAPHAIECRGDAVLIAIGDGAAQSRPLMAALWQSSRIAGAPITDHSDPAN
ncbi:MAG TPA: hypothetical protein VEC38_06775 [Candidatus Binataceae bacterium]|nr:hypothetical protein [Candidatus Binataceae bacterium]